MHRNVFGMLKIQNPSRLNPRVIPHRTPRRRRPFSRFTCGVTGVALALGVMGIGACQPASLVVGLVPNVQELTESPVAGDQRASDKVALLDITGVIINADRPGLLVDGRNPVADLTEQLNRARDDRRVKAVVLRINSPGGGVTASDAMYRELMRFREQTGKPVVAVLMDVAASGGYYVACGTDRIVAYPTSVTGSVGVLIQLVSVKPALDKLGVQAVTLTSGDLKAAGSPLTELTQAQQASLQRLVDQFYERFTAVVRQRPGLAADDHPQMQAVLDGRVVSGTDAVAVGLADELGDVHDAFAAARVLAGSERAKLVRYHRPLQYVASPYSHANPGTTPSRGTQINLAQINLGSTGLGPHATAGFYYLWQPAGP